MPEFLDSDALPCVSDPPWGLATTAIRADPPARIGRLSRWCDVYDLLGMLAVPQPTDITRACRITLKKNVPPPDAEAGRESVVTIAVHGTKNAAIRA